MRRSPENDRLRIRHMLEAAQKLQAHTAGKSRDDLETDELLSLAVVRLLEILGEAAAHVTAETRERYPNIPWRDIADTRNRVIHGYFDIDLGIVWNTVTVNIPVLATELETILETFDAW